MSGGDRGRWHVTGLRLRCVANRGVFLPGGRRPRGTTAASAFAVTPGRTYVAAGCWRLRTT